jgi:CheY-like chemotaxis protein
MSGYIGPRRTIVVADDDAAHRDLLREILVPLGFVLLTAPDGASCLELAEECEPDLFLLDIAMPGIDGMETARRLRAAGHTRAAIVMVSANMTAPKAQSPADAHDDFVPKPIDLQKLFDRIEALLKVEWTYDASPKKKVLQVAPKTYALARNHIDELKRLAGIGYIRGIQAKLVELETQSPESKGLVDDLNVHIRNFDLRRFVATLETIPGE